MNAPISPSAASGSQVAEPCRATLNCTGTILDGYCTVCGKVAGRSVAVAPSDRMSAPSSRPDTGARPSTGDRLDTSGTGPSSRSSSTGTAGTFGSDSSWSPPTGRTSSGVRRRTSTTLVELPVMPAVDPSTAVMDLPLVPEDKRFCSGCNSEVGRSKGGRPGRVTGFCSKCRLPYSFVPALAPGDLLADQYRVLGCLAYGGLGWIYLAQDERVSNRWVVLKGILNAGDVDAMAAALAERQFLARVEHPNVVRIYNVVQHGGAGYIVMEYIGGMTLKNLLKQRRQAGEGPLPLDLGIAYILAILPAFGYLHDLGLVYNDFKPDNVMLQGDDVKLIDLGAVTWLEDPDPVIYGTEGFQAPEVAVQGPSIAADLYSIARCLAVLVLDVPRYQSTHRYRLPSKDEESLFQQHESFYRFLMKATAHDPKDRYQSADEMADALEAVLREVAAVSKGSPRPAPSKLFGGDMMAIRGTVNGAGGANGGGPGPDWRHLPPLVVNPADPAASYVLNALILDPVQQVLTLQDALKQRLIEPSAEAQLGLARALIEVGRHTEAESTLASMERVNHREWRGNWYRGLSLLAQGRASEAALAFDLVYSELPGELAPKLGVALAGELAGDLDTAARHYEVVGSADPSFTSAAFGLARVRRAQGDVAGAVRAYQRVPPTSSLHQQAQIALAGTLIQGGRSGPTLDDLVRASAVIERLQLSDEQRAKLAVDLFEATLKRLTSGSLQAPAEMRILGQPLRETPVRVGLERAYRDLAWLASGDDRIRLVDRANQVRPVTPV